MNYRYYIKEVIDRNNKMNYGLTLREIIQTVRYRYERDQNVGYYGW